MRPDQFHKRMRAICGQTENGRVRDDALLVDVSVLAEEAPGFADGIRVLQDRIHRDARPMAVTGAA